MCELFCLSSRRPTRTTFSLRHFAAHGAPDTRNIDGSCHGRWQQPRQHPALHARAGRAHPPPLAARLAIVEAFAAEMRPLGIANFLYSDGEFVFGHGHRRTQADGVVAPPGLWVRHSRRSGPHTSSIAPPAASGVTIHQDEQASEHMQELTLLASVPVTGGHWSPLAEGEVVVLSSGKLAERTM